MEIRRDNDPAETAEWREALASVLAFEGPDRGSFLLGELMAEAQRTGIVAPFSATTPYLNTIRPEQQTPHPGDRMIEHRIRSLVRWNAIAIIMRANKASSELGGHIASFQSAATLYDTGFIISGMARPTPMAVILCIFRDIAPPVSTPAPSWKAG